MTIFAVIQDEATGPRGTLAQAVAQSGMANYPYGSGAWLVSHNGTAADVSDRIGITQGEWGSGIVVEVASYWGRSNPAVWTWIKTQWEGRAVG